MTRRPRSQTSRVCAACGGRCLWDGVGAWVCRRRACGSEWYPEHDPIRYAPPDNRGERLGTVSEARDALGLPDSAAVWEAVVADRLVAHYDDPDRPQTWIIYRPRT